VTITKSSRYFKQRYFKQRYFKSIATRTFAAVTAMVVGLLFIFAEPTRAAAPWTDIFKKPSVTNASGFTSPVLKNEPTLEPARFLVPNEFDNHLQFGSILQQPQKPDRPRAIVTVGTLRAFNELGALKRDYLVILDFAPDVAEFNAALARLIAQHDRLVTLQTLIGTKSSLNSTDSVSERQRVRNVIEEKMKERRALGAAALPCEIEDRTLAKFLSKPALTGYAYDSWLSALHEWTLSDSRYQSTFFGDAISFDHVKNAIRENRVLSATGSLTGRSTMASIAQFLRSRQITVSELDLSNSLRGIVSLHDRSTLSQFAKNIQSLPVNDLTLVLATESTDQLTHANSDTRTQRSLGARAAAKDWSYFVIKFSDFSNRVASLKGGSDLDHYLKSNLSQEVKSTAAQQRPLCSLLF
jgi:hypothetical protein